MTHRLLYDAKSAAETLSISERHLADLRRAGKVVAVKEGKRWAYRHEDLQAYADRLPTSMEAAS